jgi:di/tricarboxylate transporter
LITGDTWLVFGLLALTIILFLSERLRLDLVAILALLALMLTGLLTPGEALAGFSDPIVLIIAGLFVVGGGLFQTGVANALGNWLARIAGQNEASLIVVIMLVVALLSAFMSSTGTTAVLLPMVVSLAWNAKISPSRLLIPLAFASLIGGMLTLIGTPPNIVVSNQLAHEGLEPFGFFAFTPVGLIMLVIGVAFMASVGRRLLPDRSPSRAYAYADQADALSLSDLAESYQLPGNVFRLRVRRHSSLVGQTLAATNLRTRYHVNVLEVQPWPDGQALPSPARPVDPNSIIEVHAILHVQGKAEDVATLAREQALGILPDEEFGGRFISRELGMAEVLLTPRSRLIGQTLQQARFRDKYDVTVLAVMRLGEPLQTGLATTRLRFGDTLLVQGPWQKINVLREERHDFVVVGQPREMAEALRATKRAPVAVAIMVGMLALMTLNIVPTVTAVLLAAAAMVLTGCLTMEDAYRSMSWESVVLIAGMLPMATALQKTGGVQFIAHGLTTSLGRAGPLAVMAGLFVLTTIFSQFISNTATTVLIAPIAFQAALSLDASPHAFLMTVAVAASTAFATPITSR